MHFHSTNEIKFKLFPKLRPNNYSNTPVKTFYKITVTALFLSTVERYDTLILN